MASIKEKDWGVRSYSKFTGSGTFADPYVRSVDVDSSVLPSGASTEAKQDDAITNQTDGTQKTQIVDTGGVVAKVDDMTFTLQTIDHTHHEIHEGDHYYIQGYAELDDTDTLYIKMVTPDTDVWSHFVFSIRSSGICATTLDEAATGGMADGSGVTPLNNDRNSTNTSGMVFTSGVTIATSYTTRIENDKWGAAGFKQTIGGGGGREDELLLKRNTTYLRTFTSGSAANIVQFRASWYEQPNP